MSTRPLIGLNADFRAARKDSPAYAFLAAGYFDSVRRAGGVPVIVPPYEEAGDVDSVLEHLDGFVMVGGQDLDPRRDGFMLHPSVRLLDERREKFDRQLVQRLAKRRVPLLAIGVGMQLMNVAMGGNLFLHIPEDLPNAIPHKDPQDPQHRHGLAVTPGSLMDRVYGDGEIRVNSFHHMAIDEVAPGFAVTARCPDGVIEAIESIREDWFAVGTQFHPEADSASALDQRIFEEFVEGTTSQRIELRMVALYAAPACWFGTGERVQSPPRPVHRASWKTEPRGRPSLVEDRASWKTEQVSVNAEAFLVEESNAKGVFGSLSSSVHPLFIPHIFSYPPRDPLSAAPEGPSLIVPWAEAQGTRLLISFPPWRGRREHRGNRKTRIRSQPDRNGPLAPTTLETTLHNRASDVGPSGAT